MLKESLVTVIIPAYNAETTITETINSVLAQTYEKFELIVVDDGSTDSTKQIVYEFVSKYPFVSLYSKSNEGLPTTRNYGFQYAQGEYLLFVDADDLIAPTFLEECVAKFIEFPFLDIVTTQTQFFERETGIFVLPPFSHKKLLLTNCFTVTSMMKSANFKDIGMFDGTMKFYEDWEMWIRMVQKYDQVYKIDKPLFFYRKKISKNAMTDMDRVYQHAERARLEIYYKHYDLYLKNGFGLHDFYQLVENDSKFKKKYYNVWYRKLFYSIIKKKK